jgi:hypothetical protein
LGSLIADAMSAPVTAPPDRMARREAMTAPRVRSSDRPRRDDRVEVVIAFHDAAIARSR